MASRAREALGRPAPDTPDARVKERGGSGAHAPARAVEPRGATRTHTRVAASSRAPPAGETPKQAWVSFSRAGGLQAIFFLFLFSNISLSNMYYLLTF